ncbi:hypothetical protein [Cupriavidus sp. YAF13]|uniref:hypothetical protein n=1 Tax=Cupriavidus sp. YAF13 TaxID=3233075 RepID=UPI003F8EA520
MRTLTLLCAAAAALLTGCAATQNLTASDLRTPEHAYGATVLPMTIAQVRTALFDYHRNCRPHASADHDPTGLGRLTIQGTGMGMTTASVLYAIDFDGLPDGKTQVRGYAYYTADRVMIDKTLATIKDPKNCLL